jgi:MSHA biogenesis protein MshI
MRQLAVNIFTKLGVGKREQHSRLGIDISDAGIAQASMRPQTGGRPRLISCGFESYSEADEMNAALGRLRTQRLPVNSVISGGSYQLLLVEAPDVPEAELRAAVRWHIKDLIDFHIDDAVIDVFEMPEQSRGGQTRMMYAVAARNEVVQQHVDLLNNRGFPLNAIDIPELCLRNLAAHLPEDADGIALLYLGEKHSLLSVTKNKLVYLTRHIDIAAVGIGDQHHSEVIENLLLEIRRSLDYFESHYDQKPVSTFYVAGLTEAEREHLAAELSIPIKQLTLACCVDVDFEVDPETERRCLPAVGAALRVDPVSL